MENTVERTRKLLSPARMAHLTQSPQHKSLLSLDGSGGSSRELIPVDQIRCMTNTNSSPRPPNRLLKSKN